MRLKMSIVQTRSDVHAVIDAIPLVIGRFRDLSIDRSGVLDPSTGSSRAGLAITSGVHPRAGSRYRLVTQGPPRPDVQTAGRKGASATPPLSTVQRAPVTREIELQANDHRNVELTARTLDASSHELTIAIREPDQPGTVEVHSVQRIAGRWPIGGKLTLVGTVDLARIRRGDGSSSAAAVRVRHRRLAGAATLTAVSADDASIHLEIDAKVRGRGLARPLVAVAGLMFGRRIRRSLDNLSHQMMTDWPRRRATQGELAADTLADEMLADWLAMVVTAVEPDPSGPLHR